MTKSTTALSFPRLHWRTPRTWVADFVGKRRRLDVVLAHAAHAARISASRRLDTVPLPKQK